MAPSPELFRQIALLSCVHIYTYKSDCVFAGGEYLAVHACEGGYRRLNLPEGGFTAENAITKESVSVNGLFIDLKLEKHETVILRLKKED